MHSSCAQAVYSFWKACGQKAGVFRSYETTHNSLWKTSGFTHSLYTICIQKYQGFVDNITSVSDWFYTLSTQPTKTTTK